MYKNHSMYVIAKFMQRLTKVMADQRLANGISQGLPQCFRGMEGTETVTPSRANPSGLAGNATFLMLIHLLAQLVSLRLHLLGFQKEKSIRHQIYAQEAPVSCTTPSGKSFSWDMLPLQWQGKWSRSGLGARWQVGN